MSDLVILTLENGDPIRCTDLDDVRKKAMCLSRGMVVVEIILEGEGGPITTLKFDPDRQDWAPA